MGRTYQTVGRLLRYLGQGAGKPEDALGYFAHVNAAKCSHNLKYRKNVRKHLFENCREHVQGELEILSPHIIITQGDQAANVVAPWQVEGHSGWGIVENGKLYAFWLLLVHPTAQGQAFVAEKRFWPKLFRWAARWVDANY